VSMVRTVAVLLVVHAPEPSVAVIIFLVKEAEPELLLRLPSEGSACRSQSRCYVNYRNYSSGTQSVISRFPFVPKKRIVAKVTVLFMDNSCVNPA
jgi:hypothetical protein